MFAQHLSVRICASVWDALKRVASTYCTKRVNWYELCPVLELGTDAYMHDEMGNTYLAQFGFRKFALDKNPKHRFNAHWFFLSANKIQIRAAAISQMGTDTGRSSNMADCVSTFRMFADRMRTSCVCPKNELWTINTLPEGTNWTSQIRMRKRCDDSYCGRTFNRRQFMYRPKPFAQHANDHYFEVICNILRENSLIISVNLLLAICVVSCGVAACCSVHGIQWK